MIAPQTDATLSGVQVVLKPILYADIFDFPLNIDILDKVKPIYEEVDGWQESTCNVRDFKKLPLNARRYINRLEEILGVRIKYISIGSKRDQIIVR